MPGDIRVSLPAQPEFLHILRSVVASAAASQDFTFDAIDDLRLVVDEACGQVLGLSSGASTLRLVIGFADSSLELTVSTDGQRTEPPETVQGSMAWMILSSLSDNLKLQPGEVPSVRLVKRNKREA
ncbi:MAG TPA: ATP-binding protein [Actinomycetota bacterium]|nr:ATP-binding protein [Actinomycetota bacterium]